MTTRHARLSPEQRRQAEHAEGSDSVIVATSVRIDVGDPIGSSRSTPSSVASFLQRLGRSGRRAGDSNTLLLATRDPVQACGTCLGAGYVEPVTPPPMPAHLLAHQLLALALQEGAVGGCT